MIPLEFAPSTFLIPISFFLLSDEYAINPNNPRQATKIANPENIPNIFIIFKSD